MNYSNPQEHVPDAERNNRVITERVHACYHHLPYVHLSRTLTKYMVIEYTKKLNYFAAQNDVTKYYTPRMILHQQNINLTNTVNMFLGSMFKHMTNQLIATLMKPAPWIASIWGQFQALKVFMSYGTWQQTVYLFALHHINSNYTRCH